MILFFLISTILLLQIPVAFCLHSAGTDGRGTYGNPHQPSHRRRLIRRAPHAVFLKAGPVVPGLDKRNVGDRQY